MATHTPTLPHTTYILYKFTPPLTKHIHTHTHTHTHTTHTHIYIYIHTHVYTHIISGGVDICALLQQGSHNVYVPVLAREDESGHAL